MDLETIKRCWHEETQALPPRLEEGPVVRMVTDRVADLRRRVRRRMRREAWYYLPMMAVVGAGLASGFTTNRVLAAISVGLLLGVVMATLWQAQRSIEDVPLDRSVREALLDLGSKVEGAGRAYLAVYVALFVVAAGALVGFVWWRHGASPLLAGTGAVGVLVVVWSHRTGRAYVERMFRRYQVELAECLRQLQEPM
jgi:hypothetical protein